MKTDNEIYRSYVKKNNIPVHCGGLTPLERSLMQLARQSERKERVKKMTEKLKKQLDAELKRLKERKNKSGSQQEYTSIDGSILTVRKILGWLK